jgi:hypothetical protein
MMMKWLRRLFQRDATKPRPTKPFDWSLTLWSERPPRGADPDDPKYFFGGFPVSYWKIPGFAEEIQRLDREWANDWNRIFKLKQEAEAHGDRVDLGIYRGITDPKEIERLLLHK